MPNSDDQFLDLSPYYIPPDYTETARVVGRSLERERLRAGFMQAPQEATPAAEEPPVYRDCPHCGNRITATNKIETFKLEGVDKVGCVSCVKHCEDCSCTNFRNCMVRMEPTWAVRSSSTTWNYKWVCTTCSPKYDRCSNCHGRDLNIPQVDLYQLQINGVDSWVGPYDVLRMRERGEQIANPYSYVSRPQPVCSGCQESYPPCYKCNRQISQGIQFTTEGRLCAECAVDYGSYCTDCGNIELASDIDANHECKRCRCRVMKCYSYKPKPVFKKVKFERNPFYYGIELEVESRDDYANEMAQRLRDALGPDFYFKYDGSLDDDYGIEIVTHPITLAYWLQQDFGKKLESFSHELAAFHRENCGLHIHISKNAFGSDQEHLFRFIEFHYQNEKFITFIGQRKLNDYCQLVSSVKPDVIKDRLQRSGAALSAGHYDAVNIENEHTVELRYFRSNILSDRLVKNMEFIRCLFEFTKTCKDEELSVPFFMQYLQRNRKRYPKLYEFVDSRNRIFIPVQPDISVRGIAQDEGEKVDGSYLISIGGGVSSELVRTRN